LYIHYTHIEAVSMLAMFTCGGGVRAQVTFPMMPAR
jgi:hypothetical protein